MIFHSSENIQISTQIIIFSPFSILLWDLKVFLKTNFEFILFKWIYLAVSETSKTLNIHELR